MSGLAVIRVRHRCCFLFAYFACFRQMRLFLPCRVCFLSAYTYQGLAEQTRRWALKRLILRVLDMVVGYCMKRLILRVLDMVVGYCLKRLVLRVSALVPAGSKLPNRV